MFELDDQMRTITRLSLIAFMIAEVQFTPPRMSRGAYQQRTLLSSSAWHTASAVFLSFVE
jgi:hypothetical protein